MTKYRISTFPGDDYRSDNELVVECFNPTAAKLLALWSKDAPNLTECRVIYSDGRLSTFSIVTFEPEIVLSPDQEAS